MKIEGTNQELGALTGSAGGSEQAAIRKQIQVLTKELGNIERKVKPTKEDELKKKAIKEQIAALKEQLQKLRAEEMQKNQQRLSAEKSDDKELPKSEETGETLIERLKELGKGRQVDELI